MASPSLLKSSKPTSISEPTATPTIRILEDFYYTLNGPHWAWLNESENGIRWNFTSGSDPCVDNWQGIGCNCTDDKKNHPGDFGSRPYTYYYDDYTGEEQPTCYVIKLFLINRNLTGTIPTSIANMINLTHLHLSNNSISGTIPSALGFLKDLQVISIGRNRLTGSIPSSLGSWSKLRQIKLQYNNSIGERVVTDITYSVLIHA
jgi:hypothetical protein